MARPRTISCRAPATDLPYNSERTTTQGLQVSLNGLVPTLGRQRDWLLRANAALQLLPENATKWVRFERLLEVLSAVEPVEPQESASSGRLRQLLSRPPIFTDRLASS